MQRRARIKAVANLSNIRRGTNKNNTENSQENEISKKESKDQLNDIQEKSSSENEQVIAPTIDKEADKPEISKDTADKVDDVNTRNSLDKLNEKSSTSDNNDKPSTQNDIASNKEDKKDVTNANESFKSPVKATPRAENASTSSNKFRKPKIAPRLNIARAVSKVQEVKDEKPKEIETVVDVNPPILSPPPIEKAPESPINIFSPPSTPFSPPPNRQRPETPREILDSPGLTINHNLHHPPTPQSPFYPSPHPRIRTESLCSIKSTTVANLQPRKKVRTEDQKILDNKRESRERLSNKQIEKSQLRMFDMIYYNPTTNPMKPRATPTKERSPKKIDLTMELPPSPPKEPSNAIAVPQLKLNADGELVLDESSLVVENEEQKKNRILLANTNVVYHDELSGTYGYYKRQQRTKEWPQEETIKFYRCLNTVGTDFSLMLNLFPNRSRRDLKLKFKKEEKTNPNLVDKALLNHNTFDIEELQRELDEEDEIRRKEVETKSSEVKELVKKKILKKQEAKAKARQQDKAKIEKILSDGDLVLNAVDNPTQDLKENLEKSVAAGKRKRTSKKNVKSESPMEFKKIMLHARINESISVKELRTSETSVPLKEPSESKAAIVYEEVMSSTNENNESALPTASNVPSDSFTKSKVNKTEKESSTIIDMLISELPRDEQLDIVNPDTLLSKTGRFISDLITDSYRDTHENENDYMMDIDDMDGYECSMSDVKKEGPIQNNALMEVNRTVDEFDDLEAMNAEIQAHPVNMDIEEDPMNDIIQEHPVNTQIQEHPVNIDIQKDPVNAEIQKHPVNDEIEEHPMNTQIQEHPVNINIQDHQSNIEILQHPVNPEIEVNPVIEIQGNLSNPKTEGELVPSTTYIQSLNKEFEDHPSTSPPQYTETSNIQETINESDEIKEQPTIPLEMSSGTPIYYNQSFDNYGISGNPSYSQSISTLPSCDLPSTSVQPSYTFSSISTAQSSSIYMHSSYSPSFQDRNISTEFTDKSVICTEPEPEIVNIQDTETNMQNITNENTASDAVLIQNTTNEIVCIQDTIPKTDFIQDTIQDVISIQNTSETIYIQDTMPDEVSNQNAMYDTAFIQDTMSNTVTIQETSPENICIQDTLSDEISIEDTSPTSEEPLDDESFLNSLDLERLVIVVKQINGKDFYDIHETDGDMQNLSDKPLNLPRHIVDLIVDAMTQDD